jgi:type IV secretory pathway component VirB8
MEKLEGSKVTQSLYGEEIVQVAVLNKWLKMAVALLSGTLVLALVIIALAFVEMKRKTPLVIRVDSLNRAQAIDYQSWGMDLRDRQTWEGFMKNLFIQYIEKHYSRYHSTAANDFIKSLYFLEVNLARQQNEWWNRDPEVHDFLSDPSKPETEIDVDKVTIYGMESGCESEKEPCEAVAEFYKVQRQPDGRLMKKSFTSSLRFVKQRSVDTSWIPVNPMGILILREDVSEAFHEEATR